MIGERFRGYCDRNGYPIPPECDGQCTPPSYEEFAVRGRSLTTGDVPLTRELGLFERVGNAVRSWFGGGKQDTPVGK